MQNISPKKKPVLYIYMIFLEKTKQNNLQHGVKKFRDTNKP